jgi:hypothetical protein
MMVGRKSTIDDGSLSPSAMRGTMELVCETRYSGVVRKKATKNCKPGNSA